MHVCTCMIQIINPYKCSPRQQFSIMFVLSSSSSTFLLMFSFLYFSLETSGFGVWVDGEEPRDRDWPATGARQHRCGEIQTARAGRTGMEDRHHGKVDDNTDLATS